MIRRITGTVVDVAPTSVVIDVQGVGYLIYTSETGTSFTLEEDVTFYTYLAVRETALDLYGFRTRDELEIFELLISLPKIGPKSAAQILGQAELTLLKEAVLNDDPSYLSKMSGIGKKSAEKIVAGLREKFESQGIVDETVGHSEQNGKNIHTSDTIDALLALGYQQNDARKAVQHVFQENPELKNSADALKLALKLLSN